MCSDDASQITDKLRKITVADIIKSMEVSVIPFAVHGGEVCSIHKLKINLYKPEHYPKHTDITEEDWEETMTVTFLRKLEDAIETHMKMLLRIRGIKIEKDNGPKSGNETDNDDSDSGKKTGGDDDDDDDEGEDTEADDLGADAQKRKKQATDEQDYEESDDDEKNEPSSVSGVVDPEMDDDEDEDGEVSKEDTPEEDNEDTLEAKKEVKNVQQENKKKKRQRFVSGEKDRHIFAEGKGKTFEVHFKFHKNEPHILLAQVPFP